jgi:DMSO reductase anchor subunit
LKPSFSIIFFTVSSGYGLGLAAVLAALTPELPHSAFLPTAVCAMLLTGGGLLSSVGHLANPKNAWRAVMRVRTSWLSREAVLAALFFPLMAGWMYYDGTTAATWRVAIFICALLTVKCTAMIYQSLKPITAWHHPLTSINYMLFSLTGGGLLFAVFTASNNGNTATASLLTTICALSAGIGKILHYRRIGAAQDIRVGRATGFSQAKARLLDAGHTGPTFLTREFIFELPAARLRLWRYVSLPLIVLSSLAGASFTFNGSAWGGGVCVILMFLGLLMERWLFFAEARHIVRLYHGKGPA